jgi:tetratricopeptide (TPR) repeat protein
MINNQNKEIYYYLARAHEENKNYAMAISYYQKYYQLSGENDILVHIGYLYGIQKIIPRLRSFLPGQLKSCQKIQGHISSVGLKYLGRELRKGQRKYIHCHKQKK